MKSIRTYLANYRARRAPCAYLPVKASAFIAVDTPRLTGTFDAVSLRGMCQLIRAEIARMEREGR